MEGIGRRLKGMRKEEGIVLSRFLVVPPAVTPLIDQLPTVGWLLPGWRHLLHVPFSLLTLLSPFFLGLLPYAQQFPVLNPFLLEMIWSSAVP